MKVSFTKAFRTVFVAILCGALVVFYSQNREEFHAALSSYSVSTLFGSFCFLFSGYLLLGVLWSPFVKAFSRASISIPRAFAISSLSWLGRYIPGKVWMIGIRTYLSKSDDLSASQVAVISLLEAVSFQVAGILVVAVTLSLSSLTALLVPVPVGWTAAIAVFILLMLYPRVWQPLLAWLFERLDRSPPVIDCHYGLFLSVVAGYMLVYVFWVFGLLLLCPGGVVVDGYIFADLALILSFAWVSGFLVLIAPAGIGVRDSILSAGVSHLFGLTVVEAVLMVTTFRVLVTLTELFAAVLGAILVRMELAGVTSDDLRSV